jgi:predicted Rossmann-fold nucleotide-binding protein
MLAMLDHMIESGFAKSGVLDLLTVVARPADAIAALDELERAGGPAEVDSDALLPTTPGT